MPNLFMFTVICTHFIVQIFFAVKWVHDLKIYNVINYMQWICWIPVTPQNLCFFGIYYRWSDIGNKHLVIVSLPGS